VEVAEAAVQVDRDVGPARAHAEHRSPRQRELDPGARVVAEAEAVAVAPETGRTVLVVEGPAHQRTSGTVDAHLVAEELAHERTAVEVEHQHVDVDRDRGAAAADRECRDVAAPREREQTLDAEIELV